MVGRWEDLVGGLQNSYLPAQGNPPHQTMVAGWLDGWVGGWVAINRSKRPRSEEHALAERADRLQAGMQTFQVGALAEPTHCACPRQPTSPKPNTHHPPTTHNTPSHNAHTTPSLPNPSQTDRQFAPLQARHTEAQHVILSRSTQVPWSVGFAAACPRQPQSQHACPRQLNPHPPDHVPLRLKS